uniref:Cytochrome P450 n=1 Tax=Bionectria ochroleuca TaxID=29856 RepID=A0A8H7N218_BIOOC
MMQIDEVLLDFENGYRRSLPIQDIRYDTVTIVVEIQNSKDALEKGVPGHKFVGSLTTIAAMKIPENLTALQNDAPSRNALSLVQLVSQVKWQILGVLLITFITYHYITNRPPRVPIVLEKEIPNKLERQSAFFFHTANVLQKGYKEFGDRIWGIDTNQGLRLVLPLRYLDELKSHPAINFADSISRHALIEHTGLRGPPAAAVHIFKAKLNPSLSEYLPIFHDIIKRELPLAFPQNQDWTETHIFERMLRIVSVMSARAFYSAEGSKDEHWLELSQAYVSTVLDYLQKLKRWPEFSLPLVKFFLPERAKVIQQWNQAHAHLSKTLEAKAGGKQDSPPSLLDHLISGRKVTVDEMIHTQMAFVVAGIHTTAAGLTQFLYDLAVRSEDIPELREEIRQVYAGCEGAFTKKSLGELKKLDSWMRESQRLCLSVSTTFQRIATKRFRLSEGLYIPKGTRLEVAATSVHVDEAFYENPEAMKHQYISTGKTDLRWGYGRHACPGRFLADAEMKMLLSELLLHFDVKNPEGQGRHANIAFDNNVMPDPTKTVMVKPVKGW